MLVCHRGHEYGINATIMRKLAVFVPCIFVMAQPSFGTDERLECLDGLGMCCERRSQKGPGIGSIEIGSVATGFLNESERRVESGSQSGASGKKSGSTFSPELKSMVGKHDKKRSTESYECANDRSFDVWLLYAYAIATPFFGLWISWPRKKKPSNVKWPF
jgi:hypothetical protein